MVSQCYCYIVIVIIIMMVVEVVGGVLLVVVLVVVTLISYTYCIINNGNDDSSNGRSRSRTSYRGVIHRQLPVALVKYRDSFCLIFSMVVLVTSSSSTFSQRNDTYM